MQYYSVDLFNSRNTCETKDIRGISKSKAIKRAISLSKKDYYKVSISGVGWYKVFKGGILIENN